MGIIFTVYEGLEKTIEWYLNNKIGWIMLRLKIIKILSQAI